jgi:hypothetical protein
MVYTHEPYTLTRVNAQNMPDLIRIFKESRNINLSLDELLAKYQTGFCGDGFFGYFAYAANGTPAAFYGIFPSFVKLGGVKVLAAQTGDVITHKDHQKRGLFILVAERTAQLAADSGIQLLWGVPNENSSHGFLKYLGWQKTSNLRVFNIQVQGIPFFRILQKIKLKIIYSWWTNYLKVKYKTDRMHFIGPIMLENVDSLWKDKDFNCYKNYSSSFFIHFKGLEIWLKADEVLLIGDMENPSHQSPDVIIKSLKKLCKLFGFNSIYFEMSPNSYWHNLLEKVESSKEGGPICFYPISDASKKFNMQLAGSDIDIF